MGCGISVMNNSSKDLHFVEEVADKETNLVPHTTDARASGVSEFENGDTADTGVMLDRNKRSNVDQDEITCQLQPKLNQYEKGTRQSCEAIEVELSSTAICKKAMNFERCEFFGSYNVCKPRSRTRFRSTLTRIDSGECLKFSVGEYVQVRGYAGIIKFIGGTELGNLIGIELDRPHMQGNDGSISQTHYFSCKPKHGLFARPAVVFKHTKMEDISEQTELLPSTIALVQTNVRRFLARTRLRKAQARSDAEKAIVAHVLQTSTESASNAQVLADYLTKPWKEERYKVLAICRWISFNIDYDIEDHFQGIAERTHLAHTFEVEKVLQERKSLSFGFSKLFETLCVCAGIKAHTVQGYVRDPVVSDGNAENFNSYWNVVCVRDKWYVCDVTMATGHIQDDFTYHRDINSYYFLTDPGQAIKDHFPQLEKWQLLSEPVSREKFERFAVPSVLFQELGIQPLSHDERELHLEVNHVEIIFYAPARYSLTALLANQQGGELGPRNRVQLRLCDVHQQKVRVEFPSAGDYDLEVFVLLNGEWFSGIRYLIHANQGTGENYGGFPSLRDQFHELGFELEQPLENIESTTGEVRVCVNCFTNRFAAITGRLLLEGAASTGQNAGLCYIITMKHDNTFILDAHLDTPGTYKLDVFAEYVESDQTPEYICSYFINYNSP